MELTGTGRLLYGRYRLLSAIGRGALGVVWQARDELLKRDVAVKELVWPPHFTDAEREAAGRRAVREAQLASRLTHPNVIRIYDILQEDGHPWIIMELLPYRSLDDLVRAEGPLAPARAAEVGLGVLHALAAAHAKGVLHRDVKPANILVGPDGRIVLTDFGIARAVDIPASAAAGPLAGSPSYLAPERAGGGESSPAADLWGLGASLYTAVEGHPPFERDDPPATLTAVVTDDPEEAVRAESLWPVISGLLRKDPDERLGAAEADRMLREVGAVTPATPGVPAPPVPEAPQAPAPEPDNAPVPAADAVPPFDLLPAGPSPAPAARPRRSARLAGALVAVAALAVAVTALVFAVTSWPGRPAVLSGGITPAASHTANPQGASTPSAPASGTTASGSTASGSTASGNTASGNTATAPGTSPSAVSPAPTPAGGTAAAPASAATPPAASGAPSGSPGSASAGGDALPADFHRFSDSTGFSIGVPDGWRISHVGHYVYVTDPSNGGIFLLIDQSDTPKPNPLADWQQQAASRAGTYPDYRLLRLASVFYSQAEKAADWEFTYVRDGIPVQILIRNVLANAHHAYALYWSTPEADWSAYYRYFEAFADTFQPAA